MYYCNMLLLFFFYNATLLDRTRQRFFLLTASLVKILCNCLHQLVSANSSRQFCCSRGLTYNEYVCTCIRTYEHTPAINRIMICLVPPVKRYSMSDSSIEKSTVHRVEHCKATVHAVQSRRTSTRAFIVPIFRLHEIRSGCQPRK